MKLLNIIGNIGMVTSQVSAIPQERIQDKVVDHTHDKRLNPYELQGQTYVPQSKPDHSGEHTVTTTTYNSGASAFATGTTFTDTTTWVPDIVRPTTQPGTINDPGTISMDITSIFDDITKIPNQFQAGLYNLGIRYDKTNIREFVKSDQTTIPVHDMGTYQYDVNNATFSIHVPDRVILGSALMYLNNALHNYFDHNNYLEMAKQSPAYKVLEKIIGDSNNSMLDSILEFTKLKSNLLTTKWVAINKYLSKNIGVQSGFPYNFATKLVVQDDAILTQEIRNIINAQNASLFSHRLPTLLESIAGKYVLGEGLDLKEMIRFNTQQKLSLEIQFKNNVNNNFEDI